jgi:hypothetical protein
MTTTLKTEELLSRPIAYPSWPYTPGQITTIARLLRRPENDELVRVVVGIARSFRKQRRGDDNGRRQKVEADAAQRVAKALGILMRLCGKPNLKLRLNLYSGKLAEMLRSGELAVIKKDLQRFAQDATATRKPDGRSNAGRKPTSYPVVVALAHLVLVWDSARPRQRGRDKFLTAALEPLGYDTKKRIFREHLEKAKALVR